MSRKSVVSAAVMVIGLATAPAMAEAKPFSVNAVSIDKLGRVAIGGSDATQYIPAGMSEEEMLAANNCDCSNPGCTQPTMR